MPLLPATVIGSWSFPGWYEAFIADVAERPERYGTADREEALRDAVAALGSDYARALLSAWGLEGRYLDETLASAKRVIAESAADHPGRHTEAELKSAAIYRAAGELDAAVGAADFAVRAPIRRD